MEHPDSDKKSGDKEGSRVEHSDSSLVLTEPVKEERNPESTEEEGQSLVSTIVMVIGAIILIILLVLFARWIYHAVQGNSQPSSGAVQQPSEPANPGNQTGGQQPTSPNNSGAKSQPQSNQNTKPLTNTGPGNVAAVFAGSTLAAAGLHYIINLRRFSKYGDKF